MDIKQLENMKQKRQTRPCIHT